MPKLTFTPLEMNIIKLIFREKTSSEIADSLGYSVRTIETQRLILIRKMKVKNVVGLVKYAIKHQLVSL